MKIIKGEEQIHIVYFEVEVSPKLFPEILDDDFDIENCSDQLGEYLDTADWECIKEDVNLGDKWYETKEDL